MRLSLAVLIVLAIAAPSAAQQSSQGSAAATSGSTVDVDRLPIDLRKIGRRLNDYGDSVEREGLNLRYQIQIFGFAPPIEFFSKDENLTVGPVPNSAPTHRDMIEHVTPEEFRAPIMDFSALIRWLNERNRKK